jgi:hypothetical protein
MAKRYRLASRFDAAKPPLALQENAAQPARFAIGKSATAFSENCSRSANEFCL